MSSKSRLVAAVLSAAALSLVGIGSAFADVNPSTIDVTSKTSLTVHKYEGPVNSTSECKSVGQEVPASCLAGKKPLAGAEFAVYKVQDLRTNADWEAAKAYYAAGTWSTTGKTPAATLITNVSGVASFAALDVALYYVVETRTPQGYTGSKPFFITLPMTDPTNTAWDYSLDVYPKNDKVDAPHKAVIDADVIKIGDVLRYQISSKVPNYGDVVGAPDASGKLTKPDGKYDHFDLQYYVVRDTFATELTYQSVASVKLGATTLATPADYTVAAAGQTVEVLFTDTGLDKLGANAGQSVLVDYSVKVSAIPGDGTIENIAHTIPAPKPSEGSRRGEYIGSPPGTPTNEVVSKFGKIRIFKVGVTGANATVALGGAEFSVHRADVSKKSDGTFDYDCSRTALQDNPVLDTFTTTADGAGQSSLLELSTWYNDGFEAKIPDPAKAEDYLTGGQYATKYGYHNYCLVETKSPQGYQLLAAPIMFSLTEAGQSSTLTDVTKWQKITNQADNVGNGLPLTGGQGIALMSIAGLGLVGGGVGYYAMSSRKRGAGNRSAS